eukprot:1549537-Ditylum_brightwellii.AAC.2
MDNFDAMVSFNSSLVKKILSLKSFTTAKRNVANGEHSNKAQESTSVPASARTNTKDSLLNPMM